MCCLLLIFVIYAVCDIMSIACLNCNGLREINKFEQVIGKLKTDVICLQETHWSEDNGQYKKNLGT